MPMLSEVCAAQQECTLDDGPVEQAEQDVLISGDRVSVNLQKTYRLHMSQISADMLNEHFSCLQPAVTERVLLKCTGMDGRAHQLLHCLT